MDQITLYTYATSQSSEKVRWSLDHAGLPYRECRLTPFVHRPRSASISGGLLTPMPILEADGEVLTDSTRILEWLHVHRAPFSPIPRAPLVRKEVMAAVSRYDQIGVHLLRWTYSHLLDHPRLALRLWSLDANPFQVVTLRAAMPLIKRVFETGLGFGQERLEGSKGAIDQLVQEVNCVADSGHAFLASESLSVADITAAALLAPIAMPDDHPVYSRADYREAMAPVLAPWANQPAMSWVRTMYGRHRHRPAPVRHSAVLSCAT